MLNVGTPIRFKSPYTGRVQAGLIMTWAGFTVVKDVIPEKIRKAPSGYTMVLPAETKYIRIYDLENVEILTEKEYFLYKLMNG